jgi:hypothetical protein
MISKCACGTPAIAFIPLIWEDGETTQEPYCYECLDDECDSHNAEIDYMESRLAVRRKERDSFVKALVKYEASLRQRSLPFGDFSA